MLSLMRTIWDVFLHTFRPRVTVQYPEQKAYLAPRYRAKSELPLPRNRSACFRPLPFPCLLGPQAAFPF